MLRVSNAATAKCCNGLQLNRGVRSNGKRGGAAGGGGVARLAAFMAVCPTVAHTAAKQKITFFQFKLFVVAVLGCVSIAVFFLSVCFSISFVFEF